MNLTIRIRKEKAKLDKQGRGALFFQATINQKSIKCSIGEKVELKYWSGERNKWIKENGKDAHPNGFQFNLLLAKKLTRANEIIMDFKIKQKPLSWDTFKKTYNRGLNVKWKTMHDEYMTTKVEKDKTITESTRRMYRSKFNKVIGFQSNLMVRDIDESWIERFSEYLSKKLENDTNTRARALEYVKGVLEVAQKQQVIKINPFDLLEIKRKKGSPVYLNFKEVKLLEQLYDSPFLVNAKPGTYKALQCFLFSCFTGIDYGDLATFSIKHITTIDGIMAIERSRNKGTSENKKDLPYTVPISAKAKKYLPTPLPETGLIFQTISNQKMNKHIKVFIQMCSINKKVTFHTGRHTFATMSLNLGISLEVLKDWMGHSNISQTEHYAKMLNTTSSKSVSVWNDYAEKENKDEQENT